jgi:hypothetical protein
VETVPDHDREPSAPDDRRGLDALEELAPRVVLAVVVAIVVLSILSAILGGP